MGAGSAAVDPALRAIWAEVLEVDELDVDDDFFALGGNSLLATQIAARVADVLGVEVALDALFEAPTLGAFAELVRTAGTGAALAAPAAGGERAAPRGRGLRGLLRGRRDDDARAARPARGGGGGGRRAVPEGALSHLQDSAWSVQRYNPTLYPHVGQVFSLQGPLDVGALERALGALVARHEPLRTSFPLDGHRPRMRVHPVEPVVLEQVGGGRRMREEEVRRHVEAAWEEPFDYEHAPPLRLRLIRSGKSAYVLAFVLHEIVCDGQAYDLLVRELGQLYAAEVAGAPSPLAEPAPQYRDVVRAHGTSLGGRDEQAGRAHWREALAGAPLSLSLPHEALSPRAGSDGGAYARRSVQLGAQLVERLRALAREEAATSFMLHLAVLLALLHRWSGERDLLVKSPAANRARVEWERIVGFFSMVLPLRVDVGGDPSFRTLLRRTREVALGAFRHASYAPEDNALREVAGMRGLGGWAVTFRLWDPTTEQPLELAGVGAKPYRDDGEAGRLVLVVTERSDGRTVAQLSSASGELDARALGELMRHYERLLEQVADDPDRPIGSGIELLSPAERDQLGGRAPAGGGGGDGGLHRLVEAAARRVPEAVAFDAGGGAEALTYAQLDARAERVAGLLRARGVAAGERVGLSLPPSGELLVALLGVLKAGAVAVPLVEPGLEGDPQAGLPSLTAVLDAAAVAEALGAGGPANGERARASEDGGATADERVRTSGDGGAAGTDGRPMSGTATGGATAGAVDADAVALVVRTAGVTGGPRAVELTHGALSRAALRQRDAQRLTASDRVAHVPGRGAWSWALAPWAALAAGATVVGPERAPAARGSSPPSAWLEANAITVAAMDPWLASAALARPASLPATLRLLCVQGAGGPAAPPEGGDGARPGRLAVQRWYGLTEAGGLVLAADAGGSRRGARGAATASGGALDPDAPLAGQPAGLRARVLDRYGNVAPAGVLGELELDDGTRTIRTGDLARRRADGALEVVGRAEDELSWRGVRLRPLLRDAETALASHPGVQAAAACWVPEREALVACVVPRRAEAPERIQLDEWLQRTMADWILPALYVSVEAIPARPDGLPDRRALAASPAVQRALAEEADAEPRSATERKLAGLWKQVLDVRRAGAHDNFFAAGGTLIDGIELAGRAREAGLAIDPGDVMYRPTIAELATIADQRR